MKIGYVVEGWRDVALIEGLKERWCPRAELVHGGYRGSTGKSLRREVADLCDSMLRQRVDFIVFLRDANREDWREALAREWAMVPVEARHLAVYGVTDRNVECWFGADAGYLAERLGIPAEPAAETGDLKRLLDQELGGRQTAETQEKLAALVRNAPLGAWIRASRSFEQFYENLRALARRSGTCRIPNEREADQAHDESPAGGGAPR